MLQNYYEWKIVELYIRERLFVKKMHQKKANAETLCKIWFVPFIPWLPSSMRNLDGKWVFYDYHIYIYIYISSKLSKTYKFATESFTPWMTIFKHDFPYLINVLNTLMPDISTITRNIYIYINIYIYYIYIYILYIHIIYIYIYLYIYIHKFK